MRVRIGTPAYVYSGFNVWIFCRILSGSNPINITWFRNGLPYPTRRYAAAIYLTQPSNGDVFKCRYDNIIGFDTANTTIHVEYGKCVCMLYTVYLLISVSIYVGCVYMQIIYASVYVCVCMHIYVCYLVPLCTNHTHLMIGTDMYLPHNITIELHSLPRRVVCLQYTLISSVGMLCKHTCVRILCILCKFIYRIVGKFGGGSLPNLVNRP